MELVREVRPMVLELERKDADLARQCRRALTSVPLNVAEGAYSSGGNKRARYQTALGSLREVLACFEVAEAMGSLRETLACLEAGAALGYVPAVTDQLRDRFDHVLGTLVQLARR